MNALEGEKSLSKVLLAFDEIDFNYVILVFPFFREIIVFTITIITYSLILTSLLSLCYV